MPIDPAILIETGRLEREYPMQKIDPAQFENLFEERLELYDNDRETVLEEQANQKRVIAELKEANAAFNTARKGDLSTKQREQALQRLENGFIKYKEVVSNIDTGRKFYNDLASIVSKFNTDCKDFAYQRRVEAGQIESYVYPPSSHGLSHMLIFPNLCCWDSSSQTIMLTLLATLAIFQPPSLTCLLRHTPQRTIYSPKNSVKAPDRTTAPPHPSTSP